MKKTWLLAGLIFLASCTGNQMIRQFGGTGTVQIQNCRKVENVTWKDLQLWILTRPMLPGELPVTHEFVEKSNLGLLEGTVKLVESCNGER